MMMMMMMTITTHDRRAYMKEEIKLTNTSQKLQMPSEDLGTKGVRNFLGAGPDNIILHKFICSEALAYILLLFCVIPHQRAPASDIKASVNIYEQL